MDSIAYIIIAVSSTLGMSSGPNLNAPNYAIFFVDSICFRDLVLRDRVDIDV